MNRKEEINKALNNYAMENIVYGMDKIAEGYEDNVYEYLKTILWGFETTFQKVISLQKENKKGDIQFIAIYFTYSALLKEEYTLQLELYDENYLFDKEPVVGQVDCSHILKYYGEEWKHYTNYMQKHVIQVKYTELLKYRKTMQYKYKKLAYETIKRYLPSVMKLKSFAEMGKSEGYCITFGEYYSESECLYPKEKDEIFFNK